MGKGIFDRPDAGRCPDHVADVSQLNQKNLADGAGKFKH